MKRVMGFVVAMVFTSQLLNAQSAWHVYTTSNSGLTDNYIRAIAIDRLGVKWIGTQNKGLFRFDGSTWKNYSSTNSILADNYVLCVEVGPDSAVWIGTRSGGAFRLKDTTWQEFWTGNSRLPSNRIQGISFDGDTVWFATYSGLAKLIDTSWTIYQSSNSGLSYNTLYGVIVDPSHAKWISTYGGGVSKFDGATWTTYRKSNSSMPNDYIMMCEWNDSLWVATWGNGIVTLNGSRFTKYDTLTSGIRDLNVFWLRHEGTTLWCGTNAGVTRFDGATWTTFDTSNSALPDKYTRGMVVDRLGNKWIATLSGLAVYNSAGVTDVDEQMSSGMPQTLQLAQNYPNPFNPTTAVSWQQAAISWVRIAVSDLLGREVAVLVDRVMPAGEHKVTFDGANLPTGVYIYRLATKSGVLAKKMILLR
jgi:ligand-binding sensor domain-containing protein